MKKSFFISLSLTGMLLCGAISQTNAQDTTKVVNQTLNMQYTEMLRKSRNLDGYKLVNPNRLSTFWKSTADTLRKERRGLAEARAKVNTLSTSLENLKSTLSSSEQELAESTAKVNQVSFLGFPMEKGTYNLVMWGTVIVLAIALTICIIQSTRARMEARYRVKLFEELSTEFQTYKVKANEREKKLARELQDERNKLDELGYRG